MVQLSVYAKLCTKVNSFLLLLFVFELTSLVYYFLLKLFKALEIIQYVQCCNNKINTPTGAGVGRIVFTADDAEKWKARGDPVILCRIETSPEDVGGMHCAEAIVTQRGGMTSHAAVVARGWGKPCVCGCEALEVDYKKKQVKVAGGVVVKEGDWVSVNGSSGEIVLGKLALKAAQVGGEIDRFMGWVDEHRRLRVWANADTPEVGVILVKSKLCKY